MHPLDKIADGLQVADVELERGAAHQQVPAHQPGDRLGFLAREPEPRPELERDALADFRVIAAAPLGDIVQQHRQVERAAGDDRRCEVGGERMLLLEHPGLDLVQDSDREERVLVDRVMVVHVVLHLRDDPTEIGDEAAQDPGLVHPPQCGFRILARGQDVEEQSIGLGVVA